MKKYLLIIFCLVLGVFNKVQAIEIYKNDKSSFTVGGLLGIYGTCSACSINRDTLSIGDYDSRINFNVNHTLDTGLVVGGLLEFGVNTQASGEDNSFLYNRYGYISFYREDLGIMQIGKSFAVINELVMGDTVDLLYIGVNDAGLTYFTKDKDGSDYGVNKIRNSLIYKKIYENVTFGLQVQSKEENITGYDLNQNNLTPNNNSTIKQFSRRYSIGGAFNYSKSKFIVGLGYLRVDNDRNSSLPANQGYNELMLDADMYLLTTGFNGDSLNIGVSGGKYKNYQTPGQEHLGASAYVNYELTKLTPYIGYEIIYGLNPSRSIALAEGNDVNGFNNREKNVNYTFDRHNIALGVYYKASTNLTLVFEHNQDIRTEDQRKTSILNNKKSKESMFYIQFII